MKLTLQAVLLGAVLTACSLFHGWIGIDTVRRGFPLWFVEVVLGQFLPVFRWTGQGRLVFQRLCAIVCEFAYLGGWRVGLSQIIAREAACLTYEGMQRTRKQKTGGVRFRSNINSH